MAMLNNQRVYSLCLGGSEFGFFLASIRNSSRWCPSSLAKLTHITWLTMVYGRYNELVNWVYKPTSNWGAPSC